MLGWHKLVGIDLPGCANSWLIVLTGSVLCSILALLDRDRSLCLLVRPPLQYWNRFWLNQPKHCRIVGPRKTSIDRYICRYPLRKQKTNNVKQTICFTLVYLRLSMLSPKHPTLHTPNLQNLCQVTITTSKTNK